MAEVAEAADSGNLLSGIGKDQQRCDLEYGESGTGKTENLGLAALYLYNKYGLTSRLVSADGGGWKPLEPYVRLGLIEPIAIDPTKTPLKVMFAFARGLWPSPSGRFEPIDEKVLEGRNGKAGVGGIFFEGLTSFASAAMLSLLRRKDIHIPETPKESFVKDGDEYWGFSGRAHYGFVQNRMQELVSFANSLPYKKMIFTALEEKGVDPETGEACYGPKIIGKASTGIAPGWFGGCYHLECVKSDEVIDDNRSDYKAAVVNKGIRKRSIRMYLMNHPDPSTGVMYKAKGRSSALASDEPLVSIPFFDVVINKEVQRGLNYVYELEDKALDISEGHLKNLLTLPPPCEMFKIKGYVQGCEVGEGV